MSHPQAAPVTPVQALADLRAIHALVSELAGQAVTASETPNVTPRYEQASQLARQRFDAVAGETAAYAAAGLAAIIAGRAVNPAPTGGAAHLANEMARSIRTLEGLLG